MTKAEFDSHPYFSCDDCPDHAYIAGEHCYWCARQPLEHTVAARAASHKAVENNGSVVRFQPAPRRHSR